MNNYSDKIPDHQPIDITKRLNAVNTPVVIATDNSNSLKLKIITKYFLFKLWLHQRTKKQFAMASVAIFIVPVLFLLISFMMPKTMHYSFASSTCVFNPVILPRSISEQSNKQFDLYQKPAISVSSYPVISTHTCASLKILPQPSESTDHKMSLTALGILKKQIVIISPLLPAPTLTTNITEPVSPSESLQFELDKPDSTFEYNLQIDHDKKQCQNNQSSIDCNLSEFDLVQGSTYEFKLERKLNSDTHLVTESTIKLRDPVVVSSSSIINSATVFDKPELITLSTNKPLKSDDYQAELMYDDKSHPITVEIADSIINIVLTEPLERQKNYSLKINSLSGIDGSSLNEPYNLSFITSGGPVVRSVSIGSYDIAPSSPITITFDSNLDIAENIKPFVSLKIAGSEIDSKVSVSGRTIKISPSQNLPACTAFTVAIIDGITNQFGVSGGSDWSTNSRTTCKQIFSIGSSVKGRALTAYKFGTGAKKILFVGGMHGDEKSSVKTLSSFIEDLERNFTSIPGDKTIVVIPNVNPDGYTASTRLNANNVDLNRNFPTFDWSSSVYLPRGIYSETGGGTSALSEPESSALATYTSSLSPLITLTFHATGRAAFSNGSGNSQVYTDLYAKESGFSSYSQADEDAFFEYQTTGEYENWLHDKKGLPAVLVELASIGNNEFTRQKPALWAMINL